MQTAPRSARSNRRRLARILADGPWSAEVDAAGIREIVLDRPVEHEGAVYRTLTLRPPSPVDLAQAMCGARGKLNRGFALIALCSDTPTEVLRKLAEVDQRKIGLFMDLYLRA